MHKFNSQIQQVQSTHNWRLNPHSDLPDQSVFESLVKSYYHAKFWASSLKLDQVMAILVHDPPLTPLKPPPLMPLTSLYLSA